MAPSLRVVKDRQQQQQQQQQQQMKQMMNKNRSVVKKKLLERMVDYLMSDSYMYAPMIPSRPSDAAPSTSNLIKSPPSGPSNKSKRATSASSARETIAKKTEQTSRHQQPSLVNIGNKDHSIRTTDLHNNQTVQQPLNNGRPEMVKHMVHFNSCVSSGPHHGGVECRKWSPPSSDAAKAKSLANNLVASAAK